MDLHLDLRHGDGGPLRRRLEHELRDAVRAGRLLPGTTLPSSRALAAQLGVSRGVVVEAYAQLVAEGYLSARQGAATVVAARAAASARLAHDGTPARATVPRFDFRYGTPDLSAFPRAAWLAAGARALRALPDARLGYGDARGSIELREALAAYLGRARGVVADPQRLMIGGGTRQALGLVWRVLRDAGARRVAIEDPGWSAQHDSARDAGLTPVPVAVDEHGMRVDELDALGVDAVVADARAPVPDGRRARTRAAGGTAGLGRPLRRVRRRGRLRRRVPLRPRPGRRAAGDGARARDLRRVGEQDARAGAAARLAAAARGARRRRRGRALGGRPRRAAARPARARRPHRPRRARPPPAPHAPALSRSP